MKNNFCFMIRFILKNHCGIEKKLFNALNKNILSYWQDITITLISNEKYWKFPEDKDIIYGITLSPCIEIKELISYFQISWLYKKSDVYSVDLKKNYIHETAIWSKNCNPLENFLLPKVEWVHIYTWPN